MTADVWEELTPGALGRLAMDTDALTVARDLAAWLEPSSPYAVDALAAWFRAVGDRLTEVAVI